jgi:hypothetical protein
VHQVRDWDSGAAIKMGRRQGATKHCLAFRLFLAFLALTPWPLTLSASPS